MNVLTGQFEASDYVTILGEAGGIWPESVQSDPARGYQLKRCNHASRAGQAAPVSSDNEDEDDF